MSVILIILDITNHSQWCSVPTITFNIKFPTPSHCGARKFMFAVINLDVRAHILTWTWTTWTNNISLLHSDYILNQAYVKCGFNLVILFCFSRASRLSEQQHSIQSRHVHVYRWGFIKIIHVPKYNQTSLLCFDHLVKSILRELKCIFSPFSCVKYELFDDVFLQRTWILQREWLWDSDWRCSCDCSFPYKGRYRTSVIISDYERLSHDVSNVRSFFNSLFLFFLSMVTTT